MILVADKFYFKFMFLAVLTLSSCKGGNEGYRFSGRTMGTTYSAIVYPVPSFSSKDEISLLISDELARVSRTFSPFNRSSEVSRVNKARGGVWTRVSSETVALVSRAIDVSRKSGGAFDITVGPLINLFGFGTEKFKIMPSESEIERVKKFTGYDKIILRKSPPSVMKKLSMVKVNMSAIAKGYGVDRVAELLEAKGIKSYMIEVGGEVRTGTEPPSKRKWRIGIPVPESLSRKIIRVLEVEKLSMATSGEYNNFRIVDGKEISHTIDPHTGHPVKHNLASVTVLHASCETADAYATAINVMGPVDGLEFARKNEIPVLLVLRDSNGYKIITDERFDILMNRSAN